MANVKFNRKKFEKEIGKLDEKMKNRIGMFGTTLESLTDEEIEIEIFPDRPDLLSFQGFKRAFLAFLDKKTGLKKYKVHAPKENYKVTIDSSLKNIRPYTACAVIKGIKLDDNKIKEIIDIQEKLHSTIGRRRKKVAIGIYPMEKIKMPITFKAMDPEKIKFIPLESTKEMSGLQILQRHPVGKEYSHLLAGKTKFPVFVDSSEPQNKGEEKGKILSMPPIINSQATGRITKDTKDIFIECSGYDFEISKKCLNIITTTFAELGGKIYQMELDIATDSKNRKEKTPDLTPEKKNVSIKNTNKLLGLELTDKQIKHCLEKMGHDYHKEGVVEIPAWRNDILHEVDIIEDIAVSYGYENFEPELLSISTTGERDSEEEIKTKISGICSGLGMLEVSNYHLTKFKDQFEKMGINDKKVRDYVKVEESKTDYNILRKDLIHYILNVFSKNVDSEYPQEIFEIGKVFETDNSGEIKEIEKLSAGICPGDYTRIKQILDYLGRMLDIKVEYKEPANYNKLGHFIKGRVAEVHIEEEKAGYIGEIHPKILNKWKTKMPVALFEISLEKIFEKLKE